MANIWDTFNDLVTKEQVNGPAQTTVAVQPGIYEARLEQFIPAQSQKGLPMIKGRFRLKSNKILFYNQMLQNLNYPNMTAVNINEAVKMVSSLIGEPVVFETMSGFADLINSIPIGGLYKIEVFYGKKDLTQSFPKVKILSHINEEPVNLDGDPVSDVECETVPDSVPFGTTVTIDNFGSYSNPFDKDGFNPFN